MSTRRVVGRAGQRRNRSILATSGGRCCTPKMCKEDWQHKEDLPVPVKIFGACAGGRAIIALIPAVGWTGFGVSIAECFFPTWLGYEWGTS